MRQGHQLALGATMHVSELDEQGVDALLAQPLTQVLGRGHRWNATAPRAQNETTTEAPKRLFCFRYRPS